MFDEHTEKKIREKIVQGGYGRFDLLENAFSQSELLTTKPRLLLSKIYERFNLSADILNRKQFYSWLYRYRQKFEKFSQPQKVIKPSAAPSTTPPEINEELEAVKNFIPTDPTKQNRSPSSLIKVVKGDSSNTK